MTNDSRFTTPVGRLVAGDPYNGSDKDAQGNPRIIKNGPNQGQPRTEWYCAIAIPKNGESHWAQTQWGAELWNVAANAFPHLFQNGQCIKPDFAFKVIDGDSQIPNSKNRRPCDREGWPGHWVLNFSNGYAPSLYQAMGGQQPTALPPEIKIEKGYYIQIRGDVNGNGNAQKPGIYLNMSMICLIAYGEIIITGENVNEVGFGTTGALPPGAMATPPAGIATPQGPSSPPNGQYPPAGGNMGPGNTPIAPPQTQPALAGPGGAPNPIQNASPANASYQPPANVQAAGVPSANYLSSPPQPAIDGAGAVVPDQSFLQPPVEKFDYNGTHYTRQELHGFGWNDQQIETLPRV